jgi:2-polyprenyl-3-methyl-5-hydroxy-6-metoxy-1,4-benzoquinol methylase
MEQKEHWRLRQPEIKNSYSAASQKHGKEFAEQVINNAIKHWYLPSELQAKSVAQKLADDYPDNVEPPNFWNSASDLSFQDFFVWGHDHDFGFGVRRQGAMQQRHIEICEEAITFGMLPASLNGKKVLDVGCWTGGDLLILEALGGQVVGFEENKKSAQAARALIESLSSGSTILQKSIYQDDESLKDSFDYIFCSGVVYHVTDPMLFIRILFMYLKPSGEILFETKAASGSGSQCSYSGTLEKGWNWFAPNEEALGRWMVDAGFEINSIQILRRKNGRLLAHAKKLANAPLRERSGFSRPGSWLENS